MTMKDTIINSFYKIKRKNMDFSEIRYVYEYDNIKYEATKEESVLRIDLTSQ
jgi:hypothetical protein